MAQLVDQAVLDDKQYLAALKRIDAGVAKLTKDAQKGFDGISQSAKVSGSQIGITSGIVGSLVTEFINLGKAGIDALIRIGEQAVQTAIEVDTLKARLGGIFDGNKEAAEQAFDFIQSRSVALGIDLKEIAGAFLPKVESLQQFERVAKIAAALAKSDPEQGAIGARIALIEALSGTFTSLQRRFEIPKEDINRLKEAFDTGGMEAFLIEFEKVLDESGKGFDDLADTAQSSFNRVTEAATQLGGIAGQPIVESLEKAADKVLSFLGTMKDGVFTFNDDIVVFADTIGRAIADVIDFISSVDLSQLDTGQLIAFADYIFRVVNAAQLAVGQFTGFVSAVYQVTDAVTPLGEILDYLAYILAHVDDALITGAQILAIAKAGYIGLYEGIQPVVEILDKLYDAAAKAASGDLAAASEALSEAAQLSTQDLFDEVAAREAANASVLESQKAIEEYQQSVQDNTTQQRELREELEETANAGTGAADAMLKAAQAEREAEDAASELAEAQAKINEKMADAEKDFARKMQDIDRDFERKRLEIAIEFAQKREDAARDHLQKLEDIQRKYAQDVEDAAIDLARNEEDIARKNGQARIDLEREQRQKRVDIEREYRRTLKDIQRQFLLDAEEAEQNRDAVAYLRALKQRDEKVRDAQIERSRSIEDTRIEGERRREELRIQQEREIEEARIANERKLEDLRTNLERQIEEQNLAYERQLEDLAISEQRKNEVAAMAREQDIEDAKLAYERKLEDLRAELEAELGLVEEYAAKIAAARAQANESTTRTTSSPGRSPSTTGGASAGMGPTPNTISTGPASSRRASTRRQLGGGVSGGLPYTVGERGPELFVPSQSGAIVPNSAFVGNAFTPQQAVQNISNVKQGNTINVPDAAGLLNNPVAVRQIENIVMRIVEAT